VATISRRYLTAVVGLSLVFCGATAAFAQKIRLAEAGPPDVKKIINLVAYERAKLRGVDYDVTFFKTDDLATQAILGNQVDIVISSLAYSAISELKAPYRHFMQLRPLMYLPVAAKSYASSWADMAGKDLAVHARGSGTELMAHEIENAHGFKFGRLLYVPGSQVRANALLNGTVKATMLDIQGLQYVMRRRSDDFVLLPVPDFPISEAALYAKTDFLNSNRQKVEIVIEELLKAIRASAKDPTFISAERKKLNVFPDLVPELVAEIDPFHETAKAGVLKGDPAKLKVYDYWDLSFLDAVLNRIGRVDVAKNN
jgi:NitT/TauT family transport system substrate-binding protein